jgi:hypothetical protein
MTNQGREDADGGTTSHVANAKRLKELRKSYWWLPASFCVPCLLLFLSSHEPSWTQRAIEALRGASASMAVAIVIYGLSRLDQKLGTQAVKDKKADMFAAILAVMLWLVWFGSTQIMFKAADEIRPTGVDVDESR